MDHTDAFPQRCVLWAGRSRMRDNMTNREELKRRIRLVITTPGIEGFTTLDAMAMLGEYGIKSGSGSDVTKSFKDSKHWPSAQSMSNVIRMAGYTSKDGRWYRRE